VTSSCCCWPFSTADQVSIFLKSIFWQCQFLIPHHKCTSAATDISELASELLYTESVRYSRVLLKILQQKYGDAPGASKYGQLMQLVETMMALEFTMQCMQTSLEMADHFTNSEPDPDLKIPNILSTLF
jgi:hypothetical protein